MLFLYLFFFLMIRRPPRSTRTDTLFPYTTLFRSAGTTVYAPGGDALAWALFVPLLNLAEATGLKKKQPFWRDAQSFTEMSRIIATVEGAPELSPQVRAILDAHGIDYSLQDRGTKEFATRVDPFLQTGRGHG